MLVSFWSFCKHHCWECLCFGLFIVLAVVGFTVHEPSYDEAQAWQIARTASLPDIIWGVIPIYEGHPPFWHLLLAIPAKWGIAFKPAISVLGMLFLLTSGFLLFFKSPFPRWVRCCLPFSFFLFYQYGIIVRPYGLMMVLLFLLALVFPQKDKRPGLFVGLLAGLCACHLFGIAIAGGIVLAWLWEMKGKQPWKKWLPAVRKEVRFQWMLGLLAWVLLIVACITVPRFGTALQPKTPVLSPLRQAIYVLAALPAEAVLTDLSSNIHLPNQLLPWSGLLSTAAIGLGLWGLTLLYTPRKRWAYLLLSYMCLAAIMIAYSSCHHIGLALLLFVWYFWINLAQAPLKPFKIAPVNLLAKLVLLLSLVIPILWNIHVLYRDYELNLFPGKEMVAFLKKYHLTEQTIFLPWDVTPSSEEGKYRMRITDIPLGPMLNVYLDHNIFANFNDAGPIAYEKNFVPSADETIQTLEKWNSLQPMVLIDNVALYALYDNPHLIDYYNIAYTNTEYQLWKLNAPREYLHTICLFHTLWDQLKDQILADAGKSPSSSKLGTTAGTAASLKQ